MLKVCVLGDAAVGKTSLRDQWTKKRFTNNYRATIGADFIVKHLTLPDRSYSLQLWDTSGQERFSKLSSVFYRGSDAVILVCDLTTPTSVSNLSKWLAEFLQHLDPTINISEFPIIVVANKADEVKGQIEVDLVKVGVELRFLCDEFERQRIIATSKLHNRRKSWFQQKEETVIPTTPPLIPRPTSGSFEIRRPMNPISVPRPQSAIEKMKDKTQVRLSFASFVTARSTFSSDMTDTLSISSESSVGSDEVYIGEKQNEKRRQQNWCERKNLVSWYNPNLSESALVSASENETNLAAESDFEVIDHAWGIGIPIPVFLASAKIGGRDLEDVLIFLACMYVEKDKDDGGTVRLDNSTGEKGCCMF